MQFTMYLVENGVISCEDFFEAIKLQQHSRPQLGALAIEMRRLNVRQVFSILRAQCDEPNAMFGELAVRMGYLPEEEVSQLLVEQTRRTQPLIEVLVDYDFLPAALADYHYAEYRRCVQAGQRESATAVL